ncbi:PRS [Candida oxycetoniae]|uniref:proline--tRNA ligase n=1 Tax=Candida oxycetoniae TaxID=497107 RepID=A0AAI9SWH4_9ASCO|nr:PRS [Candida oxycetoniae]KAI3404039.2 PRS [Candida oxycetoniae]
MIKQVPKLYGFQLSKFKCESKIPTFELLHKLGIVSYPRSGLANWTTMGLLIQDKVSSIIRHCLDHCGYEELRLSLLSHKSLWEKTGRWDQQEIFKLKNDDFLLVPTAEEEITEYAKRNLDSYKQLPFKFYQINQKFRDEKRPRGGLLRGKEFLMKDAYSFDIDEAHALKNYSSVVDAYHQIFRKIGVPYVKAKADSGEMGGDMSHEWHFLNENGEDTVFTCNSCGHISNSEVTTAFPIKEAESNKLAEGDDDVAVGYFMNRDKSTLICAYYPASRTLEPRFVQQEVPDLDLSHCKPEKEILEEFSTNTGDELSKRVVRIMDARLTSRSNFPDFPVNFINRSMITTLTDIPIVLAKEGEICGECEKGHLVQSNAIEVGHTFYLDEKYSKPLDLKVVVPVNEGTLETKNVKMGCYGIGISRVIAAVAEINRDSHGLRWPASIAPWQVTVISNEESRFVKELASLLSETDYRWDDRDVSIGKKIMQSNMMGIPLVVILGKNYPRVEIEVRGERKNGYYDSLTRLQKQKQKEDDFYWETQYLDGKDVKHFVDKEHLPFVVKNLLDYL